MNDPGGRGAWSGGDDKMIRSGCCCWAGENKVACLRALVISASGLEYDRLGSYEHEGDIYILGTTIDW